MPIYNPQSKTINELINLVKEGSLLIPDIQREYVWTPDKIIRLLDTCLKGWPFSTLLIWDLGAINNNVNLIPNRPFKIRTTFSDTNNPPSIAFGGANIPNTISMVLDGQQRLQSLLLAFGSHDSGMYLLDKDWHSCFSDERDHPYRGIYVNQRFLFGRLYLNLSELMKNVETVNPIMGTMGLRGDIDWTQIFIWAIPPNNGLDEYISNHPRPENYSWPIEEYTKHHQEKFLISTDRLWDKAGGFILQGEMAQYETANQLLTESNINLENYDQQDRAVAITATMGILKKIAQIRNQEISFLRLLSFAESGSQSMDVYRNNIVNIFNRLNAAGVSLTKGEITTAWIKNRWEQLRNETQQNLGVSGAEILGLLKKEFTHTELTEEFVVKILNILWTTHSPEIANVSLLTEIDLLDGKNIGIMTDWVFNNWAKIRLTLQKSSALLEKTGLKFNKHHKSINLIYTIIAYQYVIIDAQSPYQNQLNAMPYPEGNELEEHLDKLISKFIISTLVNGQWGRNSNADLINHLNHIKDHHTLNTSNESIENFTKKINNLEPDENYRKSSIIIYAYSKSSMERFEQMQSLPDLTIDHIIPQAYWNQIFERDQEESIMVHDIGNLIYLGKIGNSTKNDQSLDAWLNKPWETEGLRNRATQMAQCLENHFSISNDLSNPIGQNREILIQAIQERSRIMKNEIIQFISSAPQNAVEISTLLGGPQ